jgi:peptide-methionine (S)-S-oxide reductase
MNTKSFILTLALLFSTIIMSFAQKNDKTNHVSTKNMNNNFKVATFGAGCFWCIETVFSELKGAQKVVSGYMGGQVLNPTYKAVCTGETGHAEVCQITYDATIISYEELLEVFWKVHDPTTLNSQGADHGTQYRSVVFYHDSEQKQKAEFYKNELNKSGAYLNKIVTEISEAQTFYIAEPYHQNYYNLNKEQAYCKFVIQPKLDKFKKAFATKLK